MKKITDKIAETSNIPQDILQEYPPFPRKAKIEVTSRCDLKCFFCSTHYKTHRKGTIDPQLLYRILTEMREIGVEEVGLFWLGEALLVPELHEYVAFAKKTGIPYVFLTTNGRLATPETMKRLMDSGLDSIKFSINASNREEYRKICGVDAFDQVLANLKALHGIRGKKNKPAIFASTVFDPNSRNIFEEVNALIAPFVDQHYPLRLYGQSSYETYVGKVDKNDQAPVSTRTLQSMLPCWSLFTEPHISYDGFMSACYCDGDPRLFTADLKIMSLMEAWHSPKFALMRRKHLARDARGIACETCIAYYHSAQSCEEEP